MFMAADFLTLLLPACGVGQPDSMEKPTQGPTWQEQYDLGVRYLSGSNYEEAILAFNVAIDIDPKQAPAYVSLADVYVKQGDLEKAKEILQQGIDHAESSEKIKEKLEELEQLGQPDGPDASVWRQAYLGYIRNEGGNPYRSEMRDAQFQLIYYF